MQPEQQQPPACQPPQRDIPSATNNFLFAKAQNEEERAAVRLDMEVLARDYGERISLASPAACRDYLQLQLAGREHEVFICIFLNAQHQIIEVEEIFRGTLTQASVYPREVVKRALQLNAAAVIFAHNHPSGVTQPSRADELLTRSLKEALALVDVRVLDHFIIAGAQALSFAERGLM